MRHFLRVSMLCVTVFLAGMPFASGQTSVVPTMKTYRHIEGFSLQIPESWEIRENLDFQGYKIPLIVLEPLRGKTDDFRENINVVGENTQSPYQPKDYLQASVKAMEKNLDSFQSLKTDDLKGSMREGRYMIYTHKVDQVKGKVKVIVFFYTKGRQGYSLTCSSTEGNFNRYLNLFMKIGKSFQWINA